MDLDKIEVFEAVHAGGVTKIEILQISSFYFQTIYTAEARRIPGVHTQNVAVDVPADYVNICQLAINNEILHVVSF